MKAWSIITVTYNSEEALRKHWQGISLPDGVEWIVVDNCSTDNTVNVATELGARVIRNKTNLGFGAANNLGYQTSDAPLVAFLNPDVTADFDSLGRLAKVIEERKCIVAPQLMNGDGTFQPNGRGAPFFHWKITNRITPDRLFGTYLLLVEDAAAVKEVSWMIGAAVASSKEIFDTLGAGGPWDENFFLYYEDADLCLRAKEKGVPSVVVGSERWVHGWARETKSFKLKPWMHEFRAGMKFYRRYPQYLKPFKSTIVRS